MGQKYEVATVVLEAGRGGREEEGIVDIGKIC